MFLVRMESIELNYKRLLATFTAEKICTGCSNVYPRYHCSNRLLSTYSDSRVQNTASFLSVIALFKDIPDTEGDKILGLNGLKQNETLFLKYMRFGHSKVISVVCHVLLATTLWTRAKSVDLSSKTEITSCYMFIWKLFYAEYLLLSFFEVNIRREEGRSHYYPYVYLFRQDHEIR
uniref:Uncharacterized protein n=1 Tax=Brassica oleracea TaxID=3712 RepID=A0A3P6E3W6_BRAOL|nr:unnamed protein product [Brassica oleracea]